MGAYHSSELPLLFGTHDLYRGPSSSLEYATSYAMQDAWLAFAKSGAKGMKQIVKWQPYDRSTRLVRNFGQGVPVMDATAADISAICASIPGIQI